MTTEPNITDESATPASGGGDGAGLGAQAAQPDPVAALEAEKIDLRDKLLRALADLENMRRRAERDLADARLYAVTNFARDMLTVADNLGRALDSVPAEARAGAEGALKGLIDGIELTQRDLLKNLERHGVRKLDPQGAKFDPNLHQAMFEVPNPDVPNGTVVQVVQTGYAIGERVLRPAMVGVSRGGPKAAATEASQGKEHEASAAEAAQTQPPRGSDTAAFNGA